MAIGTHEVPSKKSTTTVKRARKAATKRKEPAGPAHDEIALRAHGLYESAGCQAGRDVEFWLEAERQLREEPDLR